MNEGKWKLGVEQSEKSLHFVEQLSAFGEIFLFVSPAGCPELTPRPGIFSPTSHVDCYMPAATNGMVPEFCTYRHNKQCRIKI